MRPRVSAVSEQRPPHIVSSNQSPIARLRSAGTVVMRSLRPNAEDLWLTAAELKLYRRGTRYSAFVLTAAGFAIAQSCAVWIDWPMRTAWWLAIAVLALCPHFIAISRKRGHAAARARHTTKLAKIRGRALYQVACTIVFMLVWCSMSVLLWAPGVQVNHMLLALLLAASLAGSVPLSAVHPATSASIVVIHAVYLIVPLALSPAALDHLLAWIAAAFIALMATQAIAVHGSMKKMLTLEYERSGLVEGLRLAKQESDQERSRAVSAGRAKSQFLSNMNHELRTPMNAILGFSELIKVKAFGAAVDKYAEYAEIIHQSGQHLLRLIDDMLDLAKIENGKFGLRESEVNLALLMAEMFDEYETRAAQARISLLKKVTPGLPTVFADERALRQIIANLASNALKFTPAEGCVTLFVHLEDDGRVAFGVDDTGVGIAADDQAHVFERFGRGRNHAASADKGTGLGLAIVKGFAEAHDGKVKLESTLGAGTRVTVYLPAERVRASLRKAG